MHGPPHLTEPVTFTPEVHSAIESVSAFAPLHIQAELEGVRILEQLLETFRRSRFSTRDFINKCRQRLQSILVLMTGSREAFAGTHSTALIINTAPIVQVN